MKTNLKSTLLALLYLASFALCVFSLTHCKPEKVEPVNYSQHSYKQAANSGQHIGNAMQTQDSAAAIQNYYQFPPLPSDTIYYPSVLYNTNFTYDSTSSYYTITQTGNYTVEASCYRVLGGDSSDLGLSVNGITVYSTGMLYTDPIGFVTNVHLFNNDVVYIRTSTGHGVYMGGIFKITR